MSIRELKFHQAINRFPDAARSRLESIPDRGGKLSGADTMALLDILDLKIEELMIDLLPIAGTWAVAPISEFHVGAVVRSLGSELYLGANFEISGLPLNQTIHAEQAAIMNAWHQGAKKILSIAVSAAPCGHCRQFLYELDQNQELTIITPARENQKYHTEKLTGLLPKAFGPSDLKMKSGLTASPENPIKLRLETTSEDPLILGALKAAERSYAPYTKNYAGCAILTPDKHIYSGRYAENAAFNPGISPLQTVIAYMNMDRTSDQFKIDRAALVEHPSRCVQKGGTELVLASFAPGVMLEYHKAELICVP
jgi:cytidine deaminase